MTTQPPLDMLHEAKAIIENAYCPYSNYPVAACIKSSNGSLFSATNVENSAYNLCSCAETNAITQMVSKGERSIASCLILVTHKNVAAPCGACRQRLNEFAHGDIPIYMCSTSGKFELQYLKDLLPYAFGPKNLEQS